MGILRDVFYFCAMNKLVGVFSNKYFLVSISFVAWMAFFDRNDIMSQYDYYHQRLKLEDEKAFYIQQTSGVLDDLKELTTDRAKLEKFARERYLMKKDNEDVFVISAKKDSTEHSSFW